MHHLNWSLAQERAQMIGQLSSELKYFVGVFSQKRQKGPHCVGLIKPPGICEI